MVTMLKSKLQQVQVLKKALTTATTRTRGTTWQAIRAKVMKRDNYLCVECARQGRSYPGCEVDHIKPLMLGGKDHLSNLQLLCKPCHKEKTKGEGGLKV